MDAVTSSPLNESYFLPRVVSTTPCISSSPNINVTTGQASWCPSCPGRGCFLV